MENYEYSIPWQLVEVIEVTDLPPYGVQLL